MKLQNIFSSSWSKLPSSFHDSVVNDTSPQPLYVICLISFFVHFFCKIKIIITYVFKYNIEILCVWGNRFSTILVLYNVQISKISQIFYLEQLKPLVNVWLQRMLSKDYNLSFHMHFQINTKVYRHSSFEIVSINLFRKY